MLAEAAIGRRAAAAEHADETSRRCIVTRSVRPKSELVRFVLGPGGEVVPDVAERLPGRGMWVTARRAELEKACRGPYFSRAARSAARAPQDLTDAVAGLLARRCVELIGLARRAGAAVAGFEKVRERLLHGHAALLLEASDAARHGAAKLRAAAGGVPVLDVLDSAELGSAFARERVVHAAVSGGFAGRLHRETLRLAGFRRADEEK